MLTLVSSWSRSTASSGSSAAGFVHSLNFSTIQASWATGESLRPYASVCGRGGLDLQVPSPVGFPAPQLPQSALLGLGHILGFIGQHPADQCECRRVRVHVCADDTIGVVDAQVSRDARSDVAAMGPVALVAQAVHQLHPGLGRPGGFPPRAREWAGEPEPRQRRGNHMERVGRVAAVGPRIGQRTDEVDELGDRARIPVGDDERQRIRLGRADVQEVDRLAIDRGGELGEPVQHRLVRPPVVVRAPILGQLLQVSERHAPAPAHAGRSRGPAGTGEPVPQVVDIRLGYLDPEGSDLAVGAIRTGHGLVSLLRSRPFPGWRAVAAYDRMLS